MLYNCNDSNVHEAAPLCDLLQSPSVHLDRAQNRFRNTPENTRSCTTLRPPSEPVCTPRPCPKRVPKHTRKHPTNGLRGLPSRIWVWGWGHWAPRTWVSRTDLPTSRTATDRNCSDGGERRSRPPNPARWAPKQEGQTTATVQTASKDTPAHQIHLAGPQSKKGKRPQLLRRRQKTLPPTKSISLGPKARRASDRNCSDGVKNQFPPHKAR